MIQDVEELGAKLHAESFRDTCDGYVLIERHIQVEQLRTGRQVSSCRSYSLDRVWHREACGVDVMKRIGRVLYFAPGHIVRPAIYVGASKSQRVLAEWPDDHGKGYARAGANDASHLPVAE